eukprot:403376171
MQFARKASFPDLAQHCTFYPKWVYPISLSDEIESIEMQFARKASFPDLAQHCTVQNDLFKM